MKKYNYLCRRKSTTQMLSRFKKYLEIKGITPTTEVEEQITFLFDGLYYIFIYEKADANYFRLILPSILKIDRGKEAFFELVNDLNQRFKVAKLTLTTDGMVWASVEQFVYSHDGIELLFERCFAVLRGIVLYLQQEKSQNND